MLNTEQWLLKNYLEKHFEYGKWFSIEEICNNVCYPNGDRVFKLNTDPKNHDKCIKLSNMVREINYATDGGQKLIIKNKQGGIKLAENETEFNEWRDNELKKVEKKYEYLNNLKWKATRDGSIPLFNQKMNLNKDNKPIECFMNKFYAIYNKIQNKVWVVKCDEIARVNEKEIMVIGGKYNRYRCPCDKFKIIYTINDAKKDGFILVDLIK